MSPCSPSIHTRAERPPEPCTERRQLGRTGATANLVPGCALTTSLSALAASALTWPASIPQSSTSFPVTISPTPFPSGPDPALSVATRATARTADRPSQTSASETYSQSSVTRSMAFDSFASRGSIFSLRCLTFVGSLCRTYSCLYASSKQPGWARQRWWTWWRRQWTISGEPEATRVSIGGFTREYTMVCTSGMPLVRCMKHLIVARTLPELEVRRRGSRRFMMLYTSFLSWGV
mmetsp:Transcript_6115/g.12689  ORF Transcript_6115/g.12689 Transcript_6115/m.12689 type:complete len:235 (-) Transcript_6115:925-1629(-)